MHTVHKINDLLLRIELDIQKAKDAVTYDVDLQNVKNRMHSVISQSKSIAQYIELNEEANVPRI